MSDQMTIVTNPDGTATATVGGVSKTFPAFYLAVEWATTELYKLDGEDNG